LSPGGTKGEFRHRTVPVDNFEANPWGLFKEHGNVWEWAEDCWSYRILDNPGNGSALAAGDCRRRAVRGGSWDNYPQSIRAAQRGSVPSDNRVDDLGFRLARTLSP
jgi:formylglycine-generating enzyme required for sulfatase activity